MNSSHLRFKVYFGLVIFYVVIACVVACALLWNITIHENQITKEESAENVKKLNDLVPMCATTKELKNDTYNNCSLLDSSSYEKFVSNGWTKSVYSAKLNNEIIAIKIVNLKGKDVNDCAKLEPLMSCYNKAVDKLEREIHLLKLLKHPGIIKLIYHCSKTFEVGPCLKYSVIATEIGEPLTNLRLLQMKWNDRRKLIQDLAHLIDYAQQSPIGVLGLPDLRRTQFVLKSGQLKLADLDDVTIGEPFCTADTDCSDLNIPIECTSSRCHGYNSRLNIQKSFKEFGPYIFFEEGVPEDKKISLDMLRQAWGKNEVSTNQLLSIAMLL